MFGLGGSGTGRNVQSPSEQQRNISSSGGCFLTGMGYYSWPVKPLSNSHDIMAGLGAAGDKQRRVCTQRTRESSEGLGGSEGGRTRWRGGLEVTSGLFT